MSTTPQGLDTYNKLLAQHERVQADKKEVEALQAGGASFTWWRPVHNYATLVMLGVVIVHIWSKLFFKGAGL